MEHVVMADNGRLVVPAQLRQQMGMSKGGRLVASIRDGALVLEPYDVAIRRARQIAQRYVGDGSVVDELLNERREEAARDDGDD